MYTALTGAPPFTAAPLSEMYQNIRAGRYPEPAHLSPDARRLIARLLAPDPAERPSLDRLLRDDFFTQGFTPDRLPARSCHSPPIFAMPQPLRRLVRKVGQLLLAQCRPPCPCTPNEASDSGGGGSDPDSTEWGGEASLLDGEAPHSAVPVYLLTHGTLRSDPAGPKGSRRQEVEAAIRNLLLCLDPSLPAPQDPPGGQQPVLWAPTWVDYSSKYGFGYQLSDGGSAGRHAHGPAPPGGVSCLGGQAHLVLSGQGRELRLTVRERGQRSTTHALGALRSPSCAPATRQRLLHAPHMLQGV
uniref:Polo like kinase 5 n=1 Tax=Lynx canadensis TaxID=61383 RepID=A0A667G1X1_LYNCA